MADILSIINPINSFCDFDTIDSNSNVNDYNITDKFKKLKFYRFI